MTKKKEMILQWAGIHYFSSRDTPMWSKISRSMCRRPELDFLASFAFGRAHIRTRNTNRGIQQKTIQRNWVYYRAHYWIEQGRNNASCTLITSPGISLACFKISSNFILRIVVSNFDKIVQYLSIVEKIIAQIILFHAHPSVRLRNFSFLVEPT